MLTFTGYLSTWFPPSVEKNSKDSTLTAPRIQYNQIRVRITLVAAAIFVVFRAALARSSIALTAGRASIGAFCLAAVSIALYRFEELRAKQALEELAKEDAFLFNQRGTHPNLSDLQERKGLKIQLNVKFEDQQIPLIVDDSTTFSGLIEQISSMEPLKDAWLDAAVFGGVNLAKIEPNLTVAERIPTRGATIHVNSIPKLSPSDWITYAENKSNVTSLGPYKPVATACSGCAPRTLSKNWNTFSEEERSSILDKLSGKITLGTDRIQVHVLDNKITFYLENHLTKLLSIAGKNVKEILDTISLGMNDPEILSLIYIMFGDLSGLSETPHQENELTAEGKRIFHLYCNSIKKHSA